MDQGRRSRGGRGEDEQGRFDYGKVGGREGGFGGNVARGAREGSGEAGRKARGECNATVLDCSAGDEIKRKNSYFAPLTVIKFIS